MGNFMRSNLPISKKFRREIRTISTAISDIDSELHYDMNKCPRGLATIINVKDFQDSSKTRQGTDKDAEKMKIFFLDLGFMVDQYDNPSKSEILIVLKEAAEEDYSDLYCYACVILSHGDEGVIWGTDLPVRITELVEPFCEKKLAGKPKLFFFQACRGQDTMKPFKDVDYTKSSLKIYELPNMSDFLFCYSTVSGFYAHRHPNKGSPYIQILEKVFRKYADQQNITQMLSRVNYKLTEDKLEDKCYQIGSFTSQMRKDFSFFSGQKNCTLTIFE